MARVLWLPSLRPRSSGPKAPFTTTLQHAMLPPFLGTSIFGETWMIPFCQFPFRLSLRDGGQVGHQQLRKDPGTKEGRQQPQGWQSHVHGHYKACSWGAFKLIQTPGHSLTDLSDRVPKGDAPRLGTPAPWLAGGLKKAEAAAFVRSTGLGISLRFKSQAAA